MKQTTPLPSPRKQGESKDSGGVSDHRAAKGATTGRRQPSPVFMAPMIPSAELAVIVGAKPLPRTEVTKRLWEYIKTCNLQDPTDKKQILCDENLRPIFKQDRIGMFEMNRVIGKHLTKAAE